ncbi:MAG: hypothetical protein ACYC0C_04525 [Devosia sp.]
MAHVYFPTIEKWQGKNPDLTHERYDAVLGDVRAWAEHERVSLTIEERAWVTIEGS